MMFRKKRFKVVVTMIGGNTSEEQLYYEFTAYGYSHKHLFNKLKKKDWIDYEFTYKRNGVTTVARTFIQSFNIADIYIKPE
jgi:hypothetical protein